jgi:hypothetical protein
MDCLDLLGDFIGDKTIGFRILFLFDSFNPTRSRPFRLASTSSPLLTGYSSSNIILFPHCFTRNYMNHAYIDACDGSIAYICVRLCITTTCLSNLRATSVVNLYK